jgi:hypothetical protein
MLPLFVIISLTGSVFAALAGTLVRRRVPPSVVLLVIQCWLAAGITLAGHFVQAGNNHTLYNLYLPLDFCLVLFAAGSLIQGSSHRRFRLVALALFGAVWLALILGKGISQFAFLAFACEGKAGRHLLPLLRADDLLCLQYSAVQHHAAAAEGPQPLGAGRRSVRYQRIPEPVPAFPDRPLFSFIYWK